MSPAFGPFSVAVIDDDVGGVSPERPRWTAKAWSVAAEAR
jgi:hypothetical protein